MSTLRPALHRRAASQRCLPRAVVPFLLACSLNASCTQPQGATGSARPGSASGSTTAVPGAHLSNLPAGMKTSPAGMKTSPASMKTSPASMKTSPASMKTSPAPAPRADLPPPIVGPIPPFVVGKLASGSAPAVAARLRDAHYDAERLGLRTLRFELTYQEKSAETKATARGSWQSGSPPQVELTGLWRKGAAVGKDSERRAQMHTALTFRLRRLLDGLGNGFLSRRLHDWRTREGQVAVLPKTGGRRLTYQVGNEFGKETVTVEIDAQARIRSVARRSSRGVIRKMSYEHQLVGGRNLVRSAVVAISFEDNAKLPAKLRKKLSTMDGMSYQFSYGQVGRFWLPTSIYQRSPRTFREVSLSIKYGEAKP